MDAQWSGSKVAAPSVITSHPESCPESRVAMKILDNIVDSASRALDTVKGTTQRTKDQVQDLLLGAAEQIGDKAKETRHLVELRLAALEVEQNLSRLYPQIGKLICDAAEQGAAPAMPDRDLQAKLDLAGEYRKRLLELRSALESEQTRAAPKP